MVSGTLFENSLFVVSVNEPIYIFRYIYSLILKYNKYFKENPKVSDILSADADEFIARLAQHIPLPRIRLIRYFDLYFSKSRGIGQDVRMEGLGTCF